MWKNHKYFDILNHGINVGLACQDASCGAKEGPNSQRIHTLRLFLIQTCNDVMRPA
jgi:hypothetical protein